MTRSYGTDALRRIGSVALIFVLAVAVTLPAGAHSYKLGEIAIGHFWASPAPQGAKGVAVYGPLLNLGTHPAELSGAASEAAADVRFRKVDDERVSWLGAIALPPGRPLALAAWREHIWLSGLKRPLHDGDAFDLTLTFDNGRSITVKVMVETAAGH